MLKVKGKIPDKRFNQTLLHPEILFSLLKSLIFELPERGWEEGREAVNPLKVPAVPNPCNNLKTCEQKQLLFTWGAKPVRCFR